MGVLDEAGVSTTITIYDGFIHDYGMLYPIAHMPAIQDAISQAAAGLKDALLR